ncbi:MAG: cytochrome ubiquinol oxidase subunit I [Deltaproteobacteria bacterium]|nr:cytochrome ubiquinol oxidase subunit I [Deltaproteobacteria bacterium]
MRRGLSIITPVVFAAVFCLVAVEASAADYNTLGPVSPRVTVWLLAQTHLWFAAFILAVPIFVLILEVVGYVRKDGRYDKVAREFIRVSLAAHVVTVAVGVIFAAALFFFYPKFMGYMTKIFSPTFYVYAVIFVIDAALLYVYALKWDSMQEGGSKKAHMLIGLALNIAGTAIMFVANAWTTFMMTPAGLTPEGFLNGNLWSAIDNPLWHPMNLHRFVANISFGGSVLAAYAAYRFIAATESKDRAHYDWMGYTGSFIAIAALLPLPFAGYWLTAEIYRYSTEMGMMLMGGMFGWMFIVQAVLIGAIFFAANYYLWTSMSRCPGHERYSKYVKYIAIVIAVSFMVWFTPHTPEMTGAEIKAAGTRYHPLIAPLGLMPAKNIAVNIMILFTFISFLLYRRSNLNSVHPRADALKTAQAAIIAAACVNIFFVGVYYGYFTDSSYKVASSVPEVLTTLVALISVSVLDYIIFKNAAVVGPVEWGRAPVRSQYALVLLAVSFTWLMGLMGFIRSAIRQGWHVYAVYKDTSVEAFTPSIQYATRVVSIGTIVFMLITVVLFSIAMGRKRDE